MIALDQERVEEVIMMRRNLTSHLEETNEIDPEIEMREIVTVIVGEKEGKVATEAMTLDVNQQETKKEIGIVALKMKEAPGTARIIA